MKINDIEMDGGSFDMEIVMFESDPSEEYCTALAKQMFKAVSGDIPFEDVMGDTESVRVTDIECTSSYSGYPEVSISFEYNGGRSERYYRDVIMTVFSTLVGHDYTITNES